MLETADAQDSLFLAAIRLHENAGGLSVVGSPGTGVCLVVHGQTTALM